MAPLKELVCRVDLFDHDPRLSISFTEVPDWHAFEAETGHVEWPLKSLISTPISLSISFVYLEIVELWNSTRDIM